MNTSPIAQILSCRAEWDLAVWAKPIAVTLFAVIVTALESWLRFPILHLLHGYLQSHILAAIASAFRHRSL